MKVFKIIIDILLLVVTFFLVNLEITGHLIHEILGISISILLLTHIVLNWNWIKNVTKNFKKVNNKTKVMYLINTVTFVSYIGTIIFGIIISNKLFKLKTSSNSKLIITHIIFGKLAVISMLLHLGINFDNIFSKMKNKKIKQIFKIIYGIASIIITIYLVYTLTHSFEWAMVFKLN